MSNSNDDTLGCIFAAVLVAGGGWWLWDKYEIKERDSTPLAPPSTPSPTVARDFLPERYLVTASSTGTNYFLETRTVKGPRTARVGWVYLDHAKDKKEAARSSRELVWTNCDTDEVKTLSFIRYTKEGKVIDSEDKSPADAKVLYYPPGTVGAAAPSEMCSAVFDQPDSNGGDS